MIFLIFGFSSINLLIFLTPGGKNQCYVLRIPLKTETEMIDEDTAWNYRPILKMRFKY